MKHNCFLFLRRHRHALLLIIYLLIIAALWYLPGVFHPKSVEDVRRWVMGFGVWGPLVYVLLYTVRPLLLFPSLLLNVAAGILFPPVVGIPCLLAGGPKNFQRMLWLRTVPLFPYDVISLVAGCTKMKFVTFAMTTLLGMVPGAIAYNILGDALGGSSGFGLSAVLLVVAFGIPLAFWYFGGERKRLGEEK